MMGGSRPRMTIGLRPVAGLKRPADVWGHM